jgi:triosephosphate isomerase
MKPIIVINFKTYRQGKEALKIAKLIKKISKKIIIAVEASDIYEIVRATKLKVYAQHIDYFKPGRSTGFIIPEAIKKDGATGTLLNHSEHKLKFDILKKTISRCEQVRLKTIVCVTSINEAKKVLKLKPDMVAFEVPELIASGKAVSRYLPESVRKFSNLFKKNKEILPLCGAGISSAKDVGYALALGCKGVLMARAVFTSRNPKKLLKEMLKI